MACPSSKLFQTTTTYTLPCPEPLHRRWTTSNSSFPRMSWMWSAKRRWRCPRLPFAWRRIALMGIWINDRGWRGWEVCWDCRRMIERRWWGRNGRLFLWIAIVYLDLRIIFRGGAREWERHSKMSFLCCSGWKVLPWRIFYIWEFYLSLTLVNMSFGWICPIFSARKNLPNMAKKLRTFCIGYICVWLNGSSSNRWLEWRLPRDE